ELCLDGEFWPNATDWGFPFNGIFHGIRYFGKLYEKMTAHSFPLISEDGKSMIKNYTEYMGVDTCPLVVTENDRNFCFHFKVPRKGYLIDNDYVAWDGRIAYRFFYR
ncbi:MAG: hypothetical protein K2G01_09135, partial [Paramuribaculum sp.]|nr:hypothetical protein [Paramuribaculum sp.]